MKVVSDGAAPIIGGGLAPVNIGISDDPEDQLMILNVLSNTLYTDKPAAVLREYGCNGMDANVEAGRGHQPIEVRLPNKIDPTLAIRDFGYGMTEEQILKVFCRLGRSTKRNSNAFTGMLGIGSKAGFAYGDSFVVTSFTNGVKCVYEAFRSQGAPQLAKHFEGPTDAPDGIEVKVPIRMEDWETFRLKAERIFRYFKVRPIIHGAKIDWKDRGIAEFSGTGWRYTGVGESVAIMGNVGYSLDKNALPQTVNQRLRTLIDLGVELDFDIGELEIAANREGLQYKDLTIKSIVDRLNTIANEVSRVFTDRISKATSLWEAKRMYADNFEKMGQSTYGVRTLKEVVHQSITWQGQKITTGRFELVPPSFVGVGNPPGVRIVEYSKDRYYASRTQKREAPRDTYASEKTVLCINDLPSATNSPSRVKGFFETNTTAERLVTFTFDNPIAQKKYWKSMQLEGAPTINLSSIAPSLIVSTGNGSSGPSEHRAKHSAKVFRLVATRPQSDDWVKSKWWEKDEVDLANDSGIYVKIHKFEAQLTYGPHDPISFFNDVSTLIKAGVITGPIYGFKPNAAGKLGSGWKALECAIKENMDAWVLANKQTVADADAALAHKEWIPARWSKHFGAKTVMHKYLRSFEWMRENGKKVHDMVDSIRRGYNCLLKKSLLDKLPKPTHDLAELSKDVQNTYPLVQVLNKEAPYCWDENRNTKLLSAIKEYVQLVEP